MPVDPEEREAALHGNRGEWNLPGDDPGLFDPRYKDDRLLASLEAQQRGKPYLGHYGSVNLPAPRPADTLEAADELREEAFQQCDPVFRNEGVRRSIFEKSDEMRREARERGNR